MGRHESAPRVELFGLDRESTQAGYLDPVLTLRSAPFTKDVFLTNRPPVMVIGGGPAGSAAAILLAQAGLRPLLIERSRESHDTVCGAFISGDAQGVLGRLGLSLLELGAHPIKRVRLVADGARVEAPLPFAAVGLSRRRLDAVLLQVADRAGVRIERGVSVRRIESCERRVILSDGAEFEPAAAFLATGKHDVRGATRTPRQVGGEEPVGLRIGLAASPLLHRALEGTIELHLFRGGYAGLLLQEDGSVNLCLSIAVRRLRLAGGKPEALVASLEEEAPLLLERVAAAQRIGGWSSVARVPYDFRARDSASGIFRIGDQAAVIASLAGDGIGGALSSAASAATAYLRDGAEGSRRFQRAFARRAASPLRLASIFRSASAAPALAGPLVAALRLEPKLVSLAARLTRI
jgi:flavin-dependent dehydrogenase